MLLEGCGTEKTRATEYTDVVVDKINRALSENYILRNIHNSSSASIGVTLFLGDEKEPKQILKQADVAMYESKRKMR